MNSIYENLFDGYAAPFLHDSSPAVSALLAPLPLSGSQRIDLTDALNALFLQQSTDAFTVGLHLGLSLLHDDVRRIRPQQV